MLTNIVDGWLLNPSIKYLPYRSIPMMLGQLDPLRRAHNYRNYTWIVPDDLTVAIPARGQLNRQIRVPANSYLWGATFWQFIQGEETLFQPVGPTEMSLQITDDATGCQFGSEFINAQSLWPSDGSGNSTAVGNSTPCLLTQPRLFVKSGLLSVEIANLDTADAFCQLALYFSEPCDKVLEENQCP